LDADKTGLRDQVDSLASHAGVRNAKQASLVFDGYTAMIDGLLDADQQSSARIDDSQMRSGVELLNALNRQSELESRIVIKTVLAGQANDPVQALEVQRLGGVQQAGERDLSVRSDGPWAQHFEGVLSSPIRADAVAQMQAFASDPLHAKLDTVLKLPRNAGQLRNGVSTVAGNVGERSTKLVTAAERDQRNWIIVTILSMLLAIALLWLTNRWITRPLRALAEQAAAMAGTTLPEAVIEILRPPRGAGVQKPDVPPVRAGAGGEVYDVEVALNRVQDSALELAVEQARLRGNVADAFVNLGRRNQNLLSRQLEFIT